MKITAIKTKKILPFRESILELLNQYLIDLPNCSILAISSKIVAICESRVVEKLKIDKIKLVKKEADYYVDEKNKDFLLTIKNNILIPNSGIDESNGGGYYILWPKDPQRSADLIFEYLKKRFPGRKLGVIITDSKTTPLRRGTTGVSLAHSGFKA